MAQVRVPCKNDLSGLTLHQCPDSFLQIILFPKCYSGNGLKKLQIAEFSMPTILRLLSGGYLLQDVARSGGYR